MSSDQRTTIQHALSVEVEIEADKSITPGIVASHGTYAHFFVDALLSNEDVERKYFLSNPEVARVQFFVDGLIRMDLRRPDDVERVTKETLEQIRTKMARDAEVCVFVCPECKVEHSRGPIDPLSRVYRCLGCGYVGSKVKDEWIPCPECGGSGVGNTPGALACEDVCTKCAGKGRIRKDEPGPLGFRGEIEKGPVDKAKTVETPEDFTSTITTDFQLFDGLNRVTPEAIKATEGREFDFVDTHGGVYRGTVESVEVDPSGDFANLTLDIPEGIPNSEIRPFLGVRAMIAVEEPVPSIEEYPREIICLKCEEVVGYATAAAAPREYAIAEHAIRKDGTRPEPFEPICTNHGELAGGPFFLRDRATGEWVGNPPPKGIGKDQADEPTDEP